MTNNPTTIAPFYQGWDVYQQHLLDAITPLTQEQLDVSIAPTMRIRTVGMLATHIVGVRYGWLRFVLKEGDGAFAAMSAWDDPNMQEMTVADIVDGLKVTWQVIDELLNRYTPDTLQEIVVDVEDDGTEVTHTRQWVLWHLIEHDMHHGGELSYTLGMHSIPAIDL